MILAGLGCFGCYKVDYSGSESIEHVTAASAIATMDFLTAPTHSFGVLYRFFVMAHDRRLILHCNVAKHPASA